MHLMKSAYHIALLWFSCPEQTHLSGLIKVMLEVLSKSCKKGLALALPLLLLVDLHIHSSFPFYILRPPPPHKCTQDSISGLEKS